ncbi:MAG TPA: nucleotidyltransferase domain-containing protein [Spirochaetota bacterium]|nr:nucleotidyltransferase domain-containing protein [Spirochaetota bacterium]
MVNINEVAVEVEKRVRNIFLKEPVKVMIYGSYATGTFDDESDLDIIVLVSESDEKIEKKRDLISEVIAEISFEYNIFVSVIVKNDKLFYERAGYVPFYMNVARTGVEVHG